MSCGFSQYLSNIDYSSLGNNKCYILIFFIYIYKYI